MPTYPRISGRAGQVVDLDTTFYHGGAPADPYAIRRVEIYKTQPVPHNLVASIPLLDPTEAIYPAPVTRQYAPSTAGSCGTEPTADQTPLPGRYHLLYDVPADFTVPDVYFDIWYYFPTNPLQGSTEVTTTALDDPAHAGQLLSCCHRFWLYPDQWFCGDGLQSVSFGFEPLSQKFHTPELRPLEVGLMPLPLYDYNYNLVTPLIPFLTATITIETMHQERLVDAAPMQMKLRQGSYRSNPWVLQYMLNTQSFLKGTYQYRVLLQLPDGSSRSSRAFIFTVN